MDRALRDHLSVQGLPLVLAAVKSLGAIYPVNTYPHLVSAGLEGSPERRSDAELAQATTFEAVQSLLVDMDRVIDAQINETDGRIDEAGAPGVGSYGVLDEIARRVLLSGVRSAERAAGGPPRWRPSRRDLPLLPVMGRRSRPSLLPAMRPMGWVDPIQPEGRGATAQP